MPRILVHADLGQNNYHVGDEAMGILATDELRGRGFEVYIASRDTNHSESYIGGAAGYLRTLAFPPAPAEREMLLDELRGHLAGKPASPEVTRFVQELSGVDGILLAGGGNMNSTYGWLLYERAAYGLVASARNIPLVVSGQSLGPVLTDADARVLTELLSAAQLVGVREPTSYRWALEHGVDAHHTIDDASFYTYQRRNLPDRPVVDLPSPYICATFDQLTDQQVRTVAHLLDDMHRTYGLSTVFLPHKGIPGQYNADYLVHQRIASHMFSQPLLLPIVHTDDAVQVHRGAFINLASRYHPGVFSLAAGVPFLSLLPDAFADMRVRGMMSHYGAENYAIPLALLDSEAPAAALHELIHLRNELSDTLLQRVEELRGFSSRWWDAVAHRLDRGRPDAGPVVPELSQTPTIFTGDWNITNLLVRDEIAQLSLTAARMAVDTDRALSWDHQHRLQRDRAESRVQELEREKAELADALLEAEEGAGLRGWFRRKVLGE